MKDPTTAHTDAITKACQADPLVRDYLIWVLSYIVSDAGWAERDAVRFTLAAGVFGGPQNVPGARLGCVLALLAALAIGACSVDPVLQFGDNDAGGTGGAVVASGGASGAGGAVEISGTGGASGIGGVSGTGGAIGVGTGGAPAVCVPLAVPVAECAAPAVRFQACGAVDAGGNVVAMCFDEHDVRSLDGCWAQASNGLHCVTKCPACQKGGV